MPAASWLAQMSMPRLVAILALTGAAAAVLAWSLAFGAHFALEASRPTLMSLGWAVPRGMVCAWIVGFAVRFWQARTLR